MSARPNRITDRRYLDYCASAADFVVVAASLVGIVVGSGPVLVAWVITAVAYLVVTVSIMRYRAVHNLNDGRGRALSTVSWVFPSVAGLAGANAAFLALVGHGEGSSGVGFSAAVILGVIGIPLSWLLLHFGFANIYSEAAERADGDSRPLAFPGDHEPGDIEFVYFALTIGATFATSDVEVRTRSIRLLVTAHSVISFFYNAFVVAAAFQVLQRLAES